MTKFEIRVASAAVSLGMRAVDHGVATTLHVAHWVPGSDFALQAGELALNRARAAGSAGLGLSAGVVRRLPGGPSALDALEEVLQAVGFLAAAAETPGLEATEPTPTLLLEGYERAEALKLDAAARLAEMLTHAERFAEREAADAIDRMRLGVEMITPEVEKVAQALRAHKTRFPDRLQRAYDSVDVLGQSLWICAQSAALRAFASAGILVRTFQREFRDLQAQRHDQTPGWIAAWEAYSRVVLSSVCEAFLALSPTGKPPPVSDDRKRDASRAPVSPTAEDQDVDPSQRGHRQRRPWRQRPRDGEGYATCRSSNTSDASPSTSSDDLQSSPPQTSGWRAGSRKTGAARSVSKDAAREVSTADSAAGAPK